MSTIIFDYASVRIPSWVTDRAAFRRWLNSDDFPEKGRICYLAGEVWVDLSREQLFSHNQVKHEFSFVLGGLVKADKLGVYFPDGALVGNSGADFTTQPDGVFVSRDALAKDRVRVVDGDLELEGTPDMVLELVSDSSVHKDNVVLRDLYWQAGIAEYWLVDARGDCLRFDLLRHASKGYVATRRQNGWLRSDIFGKSFQLTRQRDDQDNPEYTLAVR
jgi:Uma2 family endonuclease